MSLRAALNRIGLSYASWVCTREFESQEFKRLNERSVEYAFVFRQVTRYQPRAILDVGTGITALPHLLRTCGAVVTALDNVRDYWPAGMVNRHWRVLDQDIRAPRLRGPFDLITCVSVLEHIAEHQKAVEGMLGLLAPGGHLVISAPYNERNYCPNVYRLAGSEAARSPLPAYATQAFSRRELDGWLGSGARLVEQEHWRFFNGEYWTVGEKLPLPEKTSAGELHQLSCLLLERT
jgi:SAM-dependent methyltransferase